jgi:hypothetical protein
MDKPSLDAVFLAGPGKGPPPPGDMGAPPPPDEAEPNPADDQHSEETEQALDDSIDEIFSTEDPTARREAFKRAMQLCNNSQY